MRFVARGAWFRPEAQGAGVAAEQQETTVMSFVDIVASYMERFATSAGIEGIPAEEFVLALDKHLVHPSAR